MRLAHHRTPEQIFFDKMVPPEKELSKSENEVYEQFVLREAKHRPDFSEFESIYSIEEIARDKSNLERCKRDFEYKTQRGELLEAFLAHHLEESNWLGENCRIYLCSEYDDVMNGTDMVAAFETEKGEEIMLGIDVTSSEEQERVNSKIDRIFSQIDEKRLGQVKYFAREKDDIDINAEDDTGREPIGRIMTLPRVIIDLEKEDILKLSELGQRMLAREKGSAKEMSETPIQLKIIEEMKSQLETQFYYASNVLLADIDDYLNKSKDPIVDSSQEEWQRFINFSQAWEKSDYAELEEKFEECKNMEFLSRFRSFEMVGKLFKTFQTIKNLENEKRDEITCTSADLNGSDLINTSLGDSLSNRRKVVRLPYYSGFPGKAGHA